MNRRVKSWLGLGAAVVLGAGLVGCQSSRSEPVEQPGTGGAGEAGMAAPTETESFPTMEQAPPAEEKIEFKAKRDPFQPPDDLQPGTGGSGNDGRDTFEGEKPARDGGQ